MATKNREKFQKEHVREPITPMTFNQERYISAIEEDVSPLTGHGAYVFGIGNAGTGKTWVASMIAADMYLAKKYTRIIITRPTVPCGEELGALPGELHEKFDPWLQAVTVPLKQRIGQNKWDCDWGKNIFAEPLQFMRGKTFDNSIIIVDEAQNLTREQAEMVTTRVGDNTKMILCGDTSQNDHKFNYKRQQKEQSGLDWLINEIRRQNEPGIEIIQFTMDDCVRSAGCKKMLKIHSRALS